MCGPFGKVFEWSLTHGCSGRGNKASFTFFNIIIEPMSTAGLTISVNLWRTIFDACRLAMQELGKITGRVDVEELLDIIFRDFCIGK